MAVTLTSPSPTIEDVVACANDPNPDTATPSALEHFQWSLYVDNPCARVHLGVHSRHPDRDA